MGGYFSKKNETKEEFGTHSHQIKVPAERRTVYRPEIFVDFYQSNLFKVILTQLYQLFYDFLKGRRRF